MTTHWTALRLFIAVVSAATLAACSMGTATNPASAPQPSAQIWELYAPTVVNGVTFTQVARVTLSPFTYSGAFSETPDSPGWWIHDNEGRPCYRLSVGGNVVTDSAGDRWSFVGMTGSGCRMQSLGSNSSGTANGNFPAANYIGNGVATITTQGPLGTVSAVLTWTGERQ